MPPQSLIMANISIHRHWIIDNWAIMSLWWAGVESVGDIAVAVVQMIHWMNHLYILTTALLARWSFIMEKAWAKWPEIRFGSGSGSGQQLWQGIQTLTSHEWSLTEMGNLAMETRGPYPILIVPSIRRTIWQYLSQLFNQVEKRPLVKSSMAWWKSYRANSYQVFNSNTKYQQFSLLWLFYFSATQTFSHHIPLKLSIFFSAQVSFHIPPMESCFIESCREMALHVP